MRHAIVWGLAIPALLALTVMAAGDGPAAVGAVMNYVQQAKAAAESHDASGALERYRKALTALEALPGEQTANRAYVSQQIAHFQLLLGRLDEASVAARSALQDAETAGNDSLAGWARYELAGIDLARGAYDSAAANAELASAAPIGDPCWRIQRRQLLAKIELLARKMTHVNHLLRETAKTLGETSCPDQAIEQQILEARAAIWPGDVDRAAGILERQRRSQEVSSDPEAMAQVAYNLAEVELLRGRYAEADLLNAEAEREYRKFVPAGHYVLAQIAHRGAIIRQEIGDLPASDQLYQTAEESFSSSLGSRHPFSIATGRARSQLLTRMGKHTEAVAKARDTLRLTLESGGNQHAMALANAALGLALHAAGDDPRAAEHYLEAAQAGLREVGNSAVDRTPTMLALSEIALAEGSTAAAEGYASEAVGLLENSSSRSVERIGAARRILAQVRLAQGRPDSALALAEANLALTTERVRELARVPSYAAEFQPEELRRQVAQYVEIVWSDAVGKRSTEVKIDRIYRAIQLIHATATAQAANGVTAAAPDADPQTHALLHEMRRRESAVQGLERALRFSAMEGEAGGALSSEQARAMLANHRRAIAQLQAQLGNANATVTPKILGLKETESLLRSGEALWVHASLAESSYLLLVKRGGATLVRSSLSDSDLNVIVGALRGSVAVSRRLPKAESFDAAAAYALYCALLGPLDKSDACDRAVPMSAFPASTITVGQATLEAGDRLLVVPDRDAQQIALGAFLAAPIKTPPSYEAFRDARWLGIEHALTTVPSLAALAGREARAAPAAAARRMVGFAPIFSPACMPAIRKAGEPHVEELPKTGDEIAALARIAGAKQGVDYFTCRAANEREVKRQDLTSVELLVFASHAEVAGEFSGFAEPGIFLAPPDQPSAADDGYLTASEVAALDIRARIVVLSACSTAGPSGLPGAPGLSGLARGFFEAGAQMLMVSHWNVGSIPTARLTQDFVEGIESGDEPSEALRRAMFRRLHDPTSTIHAHPSLWAPFVVVGLS